MYVDLFGVLVPGSAREEITKSVKVPPQIEVSPRDCNIGELYCVCVRFFTRGKEAEGAAAAAITTRMSLDPVTHV